MKRIFDRIRISAFARYAVSYLLMLVLVLTCVFSYMFFYVRREVRDKALESQINRISRISDQHEAYLSAMIDSAVQLGLSPAIQPFIYEKEPAQAYELQKLLAPHAVTNSFCSQMYLMFHADDHIYSPTASMKMKEFLNFNHYEKMTPEELLACIRNPGALTILPAQKVQGPFVDSRSTSTVTFLIPLGTNPGTSKGTMIFMISNQVYDHLFSDAIKAENNTYIVHNGQVIASQRNFDVPDEVILANLSESSPCMIRWMGEDWCLLHYRSEGWGFEYAALLRMANISHVFWDRMLSFSMLATMLTAIGVLLALVFAQRNVAPIRRIASMLPKNGSQEDSLSSIQTGILELNARNTDLYTRLERSLPMQRHDFVLCFMKGRYIDRNEAIAAAENIRLHIDWPYYAIILHGVQDRANHQPLDLHRFVSDRNLGVEACGVELMAIKAHLYLVFSETQEAIRDMAVQLHRYGMERDGHAVVALSGIQTDFAAAPSAYLEAATAFDNRFVMDDSTLLEYAAVSTSVEDILPQARRITDSIHHALSLRDHAMLNGRIDELLHFLKHTNMSPFAFRLIYNDVIDKLLHRHAQAFAAGSSVHVYYDIFTLSSCQSIDDLDELLRRLCASIMDAFEPEMDTLSTGEAPSIISQVSTYIREHFADPELSISAIAEAFDMPVARLSLAFKDEMKMSPLEYLTLLRVERSKELLRATELSIKDIAAEVGYYDASSFIRRFKQMTGVTPLQYRRSKEEADHAEG